MPSGSAWGCLPPLVPVRYHRPRSPSRQQASTATTDWSTQWLAPTSSSQQTKTAAPWSSGTTIARTIRTISHPVLLRRVYSTKLWTAKDSPESVTPTMRCSISSRIARYRARFTAGHGRGARRQTQPALPRRHIPTSRRWLRQLILLWSQVLPHRICLHLIPVRCRQPGHQVRRLRHLRMRPHFHRRQHRLANPADLPRNTPR